MTLPTLWGEIGLAAHRVPTSPPRGRRLPPFTAFAPAPAPLPPDAYVHSLARWAGGGCGGIGMALGPRAMAALRRRAEAVGDPLPAVFDGPLPMFPPERPELVGVPVAGPT